jgi:hypothetical protein
MAVNYDRIARDVAFSLEVKSPKIAENIFLQNGALVMFGAKRRVKVNKGGNRFDERIRLGSNSNTGHRAKTAQIPTDFQNNVQTAYYGHAVCSTAAIVNLVEVDQNQGTAKIDDLAEDAVTEAQLTMVNEIGEAIMQETSGANDPISIQETLEATAYGSQTSSLGGISRADYPGSDVTAAYQNQYDNNGISDVGAAAGKSALEKFLWDCSPGGGSMTEQPDLGITTTGVFAKMTGGEDALRRYPPNAKMMELGFNNVMVNNATIIADRNCPTGTLFAVNTNYARVQVLGGPKTKNFGMVKTVGDGKQEIPLQVRPPIEADDYLNYVIKVYLVYNITFSGLRQHGRIASITEAGA